MISHCSTCLEAMPPHLYFIASHFLTLGSLFWPIWSVTTLSSLKSPELHFPIIFFPSTMWAGYLWVIKAAGGCCDRGSFYPVAQLWVCSCVCVLLISRSSKWSALLQPSSAHQRNFTPAYHSFSILCFQLNPASTWDSTLLQFAFQPSPPPPFKSYFFLFFSS